MPTNTDWTLVTALVVAVGALFTVNKVLMDTVIKNLREDRDRAWTTADRLSKIIEHMAVSTRTSVEAAEKMAGRDGMA